MVKRKAPQLNDTPLMDDFDPDSPPGDETARRVDWRQDPNLSLSDWPIEIRRSSTEDAVEVYHVHKVMLATGPCNSEYFSKLFQGARIRESQEQTSKIVLHPLAADVFPRF